MDSSSAKVEEKVENPAANLVLTPIEQSEKAGWSDYLLSPFYNAPLPDPISMPLPIVKKSKNSKKLRKARREAMRAHDDSSSSSELSSVSVTPPMQAIDMSVNLVDVMSVDESGVNEKYQALEEKLWAERIERETALVSQRETIVMLNKQLEEFKISSERALAIVKKEYEEVAGELVIKRQELSIRELEREAKAREEADTIRLLEEQARALILDSQELANRKIQAQEAIERQNHEAIAREQHLCALKREVERAGF